MNDFQIPTEQQPPRRSWIFPALLLIAGVLIGVILTSDLGWLPTGHAVPESVPPPVATPVSTAVQPTLPGAGGQSFVDVAKVVKPAVVNIFATRNGSSEEGKGTPFEDPFFRRFFGEEWMKRFEAPKERKERGLGSGVIVDPNGLIITNNHVVSKADEIKVFLSDKREFKAKLVGTDAKTDVAVLKIEAGGLPTVAWADSDKLEVGEFVLAVG
ncbi:MAG: trypsin-like peptidase domain-containing protein, partial [Nitrospira sp.]|nr:trypsin-like peptidase domain-containing protein [Nitrospira sp.]